MLKELYIKNVAVIEELRVNFEEGFNVLTGETGAGKSILIDSINMATGTRVNKDLIRTGADKCIVSACFSACDQINEFLEEAGIETDDENVILTRQITSDGKSSARINSMTVTSGILKEAGKLLIDIHGQNDNYFLLSNKYHINYLDDYAKLEDEKEKYEEIYLSLLETERKLKKLKESELEKEKRAELLEFQLNEITSANLKTGESEEIAERINYLSNIEKIMSSCKDAHQALYSDEPNAFDLIKEAAHSLSSVAEYDKALSEFSERLDSALIEIGDISSELGSMLTKSDFDEKEYSALLDRAEVINNLKKKYGESEEEILKYKDSVKEELEELLSIEETFSKLEAEFEKQLKEATKKAELLHEKRTLFAEKLSKEVEAELKDLDMPKVKFSASIKVLLNEDGTFALSKSGYDEVEFLISPNAGEDLKPLSKIASGGELSRIMLALKSIFSETDPVETLIFDEIDTGVSGRAAQKIAEKINLLSGKKQILSITHLAQIASMADYHYLIKKNSDGQNTYTNVSLLDEDERTKELARIIGGAYITELTIENAKEMLSIAKDIKKRA